MAVSRPYYSPSPLPEDEAKHMAKRLLKSELKRHGMTYKDLIRGLRIIGVEEEEKNFKNKMSRGSFTAAFFLQCLRVIGTSRLDLGIRHYEFDFETGEQRELSPEEQRDYKD